MKQKPPSQQDESTPWLQVWHLFKLLCWLKRLKVLWIFLVLLPTTVNIFIFSTIDKWIGSYGRTLSNISASGFISSSIVLMDHRLYPKAALTMVENLSNEEKLSQHSLKNLFHSCSTKAACVDKAFHLLYGQSNSSLQTAYADFGDNDTLPSISCQIEQGADLNCPYFGHLVATSHNRTLYLSKRTFGTAQFFCLTGRLQRSAGIAASESKSICATHENFDAVMSTTTMFQSIMLINSAFFYFILSTVSCTVQLNHRGFMKSMFQKGLSVRAYWMAAWMLSALEAILISSFMPISFELQCPGFYSATSLLAVFFITALHMLSIAALGFLMSVVLKDFFHMGLVMVLIAICVSIIILLNHLLLSNHLWLKILLVFVIPLGHLGEFIRAHLLTTLLPHSVTTYHHIILAVNVVFPVAVISLTLYLDFILQTGNGFCLSPGYIFDKRFWTENLDRTGEPDQDPLAKENLPDMANVEPMMEGLNPVVRIRQLMKHYTSRSCSYQNKKTVIALNGISAEIYEGQITAIVGHNGSGKTTLLNILNGNDSPTSGRVSVDGLLVSDPINRMRLHQRVGICHQKNSLCNCLTVMQTLTLAHISCKQNAINMSELLYTMRLTSRANSYVDTLSNGMKRKLCTAVALVGESKLLFLDEPTSGVDPVSRRRIWKLLQEYKHKCSIILSTQSMDEADTLADRKIFLSSGSLICAGSSLFLKRAFDCGFDFYVTLKSAIHGPLLIKQIQQEFNYVTVKSIFATNIQLHLPAERINELSALATALEKRSVWISAFGLLQASLYDVFIRLRDVSPSVVENLFVKGNIAHLAREDPSDNGNRNDNRLSRLLGSSEKVLTPSHMTHFLALANINLRRTLRSRPKLVSRILAPVILLSTLLGLAFVEKGLDNTKLNIFNNLTNFGHEIGRGVCVYSGGPGNQVLSNQACAAVLNGSSSDKSGGFLALELPEGADLYAFLKDASRINQIKSLCQSSSEALIQCPIVYTDHWNKTVINTNRMVSVGAYSPFEQFRSSFVASVTIGAYHRMLRYFLADELSNGRIRQDAFKYTATSVYELRGMFVPLYGTFVQLLIISIIPATFLDDLIEDKESMVRTQLSSMGLGMVSYWVTMYLVHWVQYAVIYMISVILVISVNSAAYASTFYILGIVLPTLFLGLTNNQLVVYILSSLLKKSNPIVTVAYFFFSIFFITIILTAQLHNTAGVVIIALFPPMASIALTFYGTKTMFYSLSFYGTSGAQNVASFLGKIYFRQPHILSSLVAIIIHAVILPLILLLLENRNRIIQVLYSSNGNQQVDVTKHEEDVGVRTELEKLQEKPRNPDHMLEIRYLSMKFSDGVKALREISFAASPGDIFGLLGPNGAGKSTTMAIIVGDLRPTDGFCEVCCREHWLSSGLAARKGYVGYCPQYNPLYANVTAREHLEFYASIIGISKTDAEDQISLLLEGLNLDLHSGKIGSELSFGCKRRLSLAFSLLGNPFLVVIDEASTGVDPEGKRFIWKAIRAVANKHRAIVITTHNMEEAEALCSQVGVLNHGRLIGLGTAQQLKSRYGENYTLEVLISVNPNEAAETVDSRISALFIEVAKKFDRTTMIEAFLDRVTFSIPMKSVGRLSQALSWLTDIKQSHHILYFSFYQMSLEHVFERMVTVDNEKVSRKVHSSIYSVSTHSSTNSIRSDADPSEGVI